MKLSHILTGIGAVLLIGLVVAASVAQSTLAGFDRAGETPIALGEHGPAPGLRSVDGWINSEPLAVENLRGRVVLLDFWTYDCVNCLRTIPELRRWHERYAGRGLVIIGVHSPEFAYERDPDNVAAAVRRLRIAYPVALDTAHVVWNDYQIQFWPSLVLIDHEGRIVMRHFGEADYDEVEGVIEQALARAPPAP